MACYRLTKPQPLPFIAFPKIQIQTVHMAGYKKTSTCKKREPVSAANICVVLKMRLPRRTGEGRNQDAVLSRRTRFKDSLIEIRFCPKYRQLCFSHPITQKGSKYPRPTPQNATEEKPPCLGAAGQMDKSGTTYES